MRIAAILIFALFTSVISLAQNQAFIDTLIIESAQLPLKISETGRSITIIRGQDLADLPATSLDEILQTVTGVEVQSRGGFGVQGDISMRGSTFTQVLILLDGLKLNDPLTGHFNSYIPVTPAEIERIEILRGAAAAMHGADAVGGVINIITKAFTHEQDNTVSSGALNYGSDKLINAQQGFFTKKGKLAFGAGFLKSQSEGQLVQGLISDSTVVREDYRSYFDLSTVATSASYQLNKKYKISARTAYDYRDFDARYFYTTSSFDQSTEKVANWWNQVQLKRTADRSYSDINLAHKYNTDEFIFSPNFASTNTHVSQYLNFTANHFQEINEEFILKVGGQIDKRKISSNDRGDHEDLHYGAYAMTAFQQNELNFSLSLRADQDDNYGLELSPQLNISYVLDALILRASAGKSIRAADYTERFVSNNLTDLSPGRSLGNPDLVAERSWSEEIGLDYKLKPSWQIKTTLFARQSTNLIDYVSTNQGEIGSVSDIGTLQDGQDYFFAKNISEVQTVGLEISSAWSHHFKNNKSIDWNLGYTFLNTSNDEDLVSVYISSHARHLVTTSFSGKWNRLSLGITGLYKQRTGRVADNIGVTLTDDYMLWNTKLGYSISPRYKINLQVQNLFDVDYQNILGAQMPRRWLMGGVSWAL